MIRMNFGVIAVWTALEGRFMYVDVQDFATEIGKVGIDIDVNKINVFCVVLYRRL